MGVLDDAIREHLELKRRHGVAEEELRRQEEEALGPARREVAPADADDVDGDQPAAAEQEAPADEPTTPGGEAPELALAGDPAIADEQPELALAEDAEPSGPEPELAGDAEPPVLDREPPRHAEEAELPEAHELEEEHESLAAEPPQSGVEDAPLDDPSAAHHPVEDAPLHDAPAAHDPPGQETAHYDVDEHLAREEEAAGSRFDDEEDEAGRQIGDTPPHGFESLDDDELLDDEEPGEDDPDVLEDTPDFLQETPEHDRLWFEQKPPRDFDFD